jgi:hypothetical protein
MKGEQIMGTTLSSRLAKYRGNLGPMDALMLDGLCRAREEASDDGDEFGAENYDGAIMSLLDRTRALRLQPVRTLNLDLYCKFQL